MRQLAGFVMQCWRSDVPTPWAASGPTRRNGRLQLQRHEQNLSLTTVHLVVRASVHISCTPLSPPGLSNHLVKRGVQEMCMPWQLNDGSPTNAAGAAHQ